MGYSNETMPVPQQLTPLQSLINSIGSINADINEVLLSIGRSVHNIRHIETKDNGSSNQKSNLECAGGAMMELEQQRNILANNLDIARNILSHLNHII